MDSFLVNGFTSLLGLVPTSIKRGSVRRVILIFFLNFCVLSTAPPPHVFLSLITNYDHVYQLTANLVSSGCRQRFLHHLNQSFLNTFLQTHNTAKPCFMPIDRHLEYHKRELIVLECANEKRLD